MAGLSQANANIPNETVPKLKEGAVNRTILEDTFLSYPKAKVMYDVTLSLEGIAYQMASCRNGQEKRTVIPIKDLTGCQVMKGKSVMDYCAYISVYSYPMRKKTLSSKFVRRRATETFIIKKFDTYEENLKSAQLWAAAIRNVAQGFSQQTPEQPVPVRKPILVLLNPCSGPGKALQIFQERVVPMLAEACIAYHLVVTDHASHATEICKTMDLSKWYGVLIMSGDGLIFEAINGFMQRDDWEEAIKTPIGCLPGGSGNALCCSLNYYAGEPVKDNPILHSTYVLLKHHVQAMDLVAIDSLDGRAYSFLSVMWGLIADVDIESEKYRYLGDARFTVGAIARILNLRTYRGKISFLPKEPYEHQRPHGMVRSRSVTETKRTLHDRPPQRSESMLNPGMLSSTTSSLNGVSASQSSNHLALPSVQVQSSISEEDSSGLETVSPGFSEVDSLVPSVVSDVKSVDKEVSSGSLPELDQPVPHGWVTIEDEFISVSMTYQSYLTRDVNISPQAELDDGCIHMTLVRAGLSRTRLLDIMGAMDTGDHLTSDDIECIPVLAFRIEPLTPGGNIMVDGEKVSYGPIQGQILPSIARVMALSK